MTFKDFSGVLLFDKSAGFTSFEAIRKIKKICQRKDVGHGGTLDSFASGLLPVFFGEALKLSRFFLQDYPNLPTYWKTYTANLELGTATTTGDPLGEITAQRPVLPNLSIELVNEVCEKFVNKKYLQVPPIFSAKKINGVRASDRARRGENITMNPQEVHIRKLICTRVTGKNVSLYVECSKGTYIRSLAEDIAEALQTCGHLRMLRRTQIGSFSVDQAVKLDEFNDPQTQVLVQPPAWLKLIDALSFLKQVPLATKEAEWLRLGQTTRVINRLNKESMDPGIYYATFEKNGSTEPAALFEVSANHHARFLRGFQIL